MVKNNERGQSLIEVCAALTIISILIAGLMSVYQLSGTSFDRGCRRADIQYSVRRARQSITEDFAQGSSFSILSSPGGSIIENGSAGNCLYIVQAEQKVSYFANSGQLYRDTNISSPVPIAANINEICFNSPCPNCLNILVAAASGSQTLSLQAQCSSRIDEEEARE